MKTNRRYRVWCVLGIGAMGGVLAAGWTAGPAEAHRGGPNPRAKTTGFVGIVAGQCARISVTNGLGNLIIGYNESRGPGLAATGRTAQDPATAFGALPRSASLA